MSTEHNLKSAERVSLKYGRESLNINLDNSAGSEKIEWKDISPPESSPVKDVDGEIKEKLRNPSGTQALNEMPEPGDKIVIVVSDFTRLVYRTSYFLPFIVEELNRGGASDGDIEILIASGMHRPASEEEKREIVGEEIYSRIAVENHDCEAGDLVHLGESSRGTMIKVNRKAFEADLLILTGGINYHIIAGFGGGRKGIAPGISGYRTIQQNHSLALQKKDRVFPGKLDDNPVALDMRDIAEKLAPDFIFNTVVDGSKNFLGFYAGEMNEAFRKGTEKAADSFGISLKNPFDLVLCSTGGHPKDGQLYQSVKALFNAGLACREGGHIVLVSSCSEGIGPPEFKEWFDAGSPDEIEENLRKNFTMTGYVALRTSQINSQNSVYLISELDPEDVQRMGMIPVQEPENVIDKILADGKKRDDADIKKACVMPQGAMTFPVS